MLETIDLDVEEANELLFRVKVEGAGAPARVRLVCESDDVSYMFAGHPTQEDGVVQFLLPAMNGKLKEGTYHSRVEVLIENRYFAPVEFNVNFKKPVRVVAEAVRLPERKQPATARVFVEPVQVVKPAVVAQPKPELKPAVIEETKPATAATLRDRYNKKQPGTSVVKDVARSFLRGDK